MLIRNHTFHSATTFTADKDTRERISQLPIGIDRIVVAFGLRVFYQLPLFLSDDGLMKAIVKIIIII